MDVSGLRRTLIGPGSATCTLRKRALRHLITCLLCISVRVATDPAQSHTCDLCELYAVDIMELAHPMQSVIPSAHGASAQLDALLAVWVHPALLR